MVGGPCGAKGGVVFGTLVIVYLFLGGCGAAVLLVTSIWCVVFFRSDNRSTPMTEAFSDLRTKCFVIGFATLCFAAVCLMLDLGRPERFFMLFTRPTMSILTFGSFILTANILIAGFLVLANVFYIPSIGVRAKKIAEVLCAVVSFLTMTYTGVYLLAIEAVPFWSTLWTPVLFVLSSLSAGISLLFLAVPFLRDHALLEERLPPLHGIHLIVLVGEFIALVGFIVAAATTRSAQPSLVFLAESDLGLWLLMGTAVLGIIVPLVTEAVMAVSKRIFRLLPVDVLCIAGSFVLRYCIVMAGMH